MKRMTILILTLFLILSCNTQNHKPGTRNFVIKTGCVILVKNIVGLWVNVANRDVIKVYASFKFSWKKEIKYIKPIMGKFNKNKNWWCWRIGPVPEGTKIEYRIIVYSGKTKLFYAIKEKYKYYYQIRNKILFEKSV